VIRSVACGAAGGIAATFNAPMAGVMFALEVIVGRFTTMSFGLLVLSSATATVVARSLSKEGHSPAFDVIQEYSMRGIWDLLFFVVLGVMCALLAYVYTWLLYAIEDLADNVKIPDVLKPAIGGALVGVVAMYAPQTMGIGYETVELALNNQMITKTLFILCFAKILCTCLTLGSGGSGGIFAPALFIGAMFGGGYGNLINHFFPGVTSEPGAYALIGMATVFAGAARAPITAILILFEMTDDYRIIIPLMSATVVATLVSQQLSRESIYTIKLKRRGIDIRGMQDINLMDAVTVDEAMCTEFESVPPDMPLLDLIAKFAREHTRGYAVADAEGKLIGVVTMRDIEEALLIGHAAGEGEDPTPFGRTVDDVCTHNVVVCRPDQTLGDALAQFGDHNFGQLPVIDPHDPDRMIGLLRRGDILSAYTVAQKRSAEMLPKADAIKTLSQDHDIIIERAHITSGSVLANTLVKDAGFPEGAVLMNVQRAHEVIVPRGSTRLHAGDRITVLSTRAHAKSVRKWLKEHC